MTEGHKSYILAAETEVELLDWIDKLNSVIQQNKMQEDKRSTSTDRGILYISVYIII